MYMGYIPEYKNDIVIEKDFMYNMINYSIDCFVMYLSCGDDNYIRFKMFLRGHIKPFFSSLLDYYSRYGDHDDFQYCLHKRDQIIDSYKQRIRVLGGSDDD